MWTPQRGQETNILGKCHLVPSAHRNEHGAHVQYEDTNKGQDHSLVSHREGDAPVVTEGCSTEEEQVLRLQCQQLLGLSGSCKGDTRPCGWSLEKSQAQCM